MIGDRSRRPSSTRVRVDPIDAMVWVECGNCFGDGWHWPHRGRPTRKVTCAGCGGVGKKQIAAVQRAPHEGIVAPPAPRTPSTGAA